jgi:hypothetical protein
MAGKKTRKKTAAKKPKGYSVLLSPDEVSLLQNYKIASGIPVTTQVHMALGKFFDDLGKTKSADVMIGQTQEVIALLKRGQNKKALTIAKDLFPIKQLVDLK